MITEKIQNRSQLAIEAIQESDLPATSKDLLAEMLAEAKRSTNGLTKDEKIEALAENMFNLTFLFISHLTKEKRVTTWKDLVIECKRECLFGLIAVLIALVLQPGLAKIFEMFL